jgi:PAT family beta-lactamase induction signal transducer AmpG
MAGPAGIIAEKFGWFGFWGFTVVAAIPGMILLWILWSKGYVVEGIRQTGTGDAEKFKEPVGALRIAGVLVAISGLVGLLLSQPLEMTTNMTVMFAGILVGGGLLAWFGKAAKTV